MKLILKLFYKMKIDVLYGYVSSYVDSLFWTPYRIMTEHETIDYVLTNKCSVARFGDGELAIAAYGCGIGFQKADKNLQKALNEIIENNNPKLLLCLPGRINCVKKKDRQTIPEYWKKVLPRHLHAWIHKFSRNRIYGETNISRLTIGKSEKEKYDLIFHIKMLWQEKDVIIIEGEKTRFGVGNSLLDNAKSIHRILGPSESAFDFRNELLNEAIKWSRSVENPIVIMALGPTATVLASDLSSIDGIQAIDLGHLDISFEHLMSGNAGGVRGKYTNEAVNGNIVEDCTDKDYIMQIVSKVG